MPTSPELENLVRIGKLKVEAPSRREFDGLRRSGEAGLTDARNPSLSPESRSDLAYNAAHALALAALRHHGYRSENRYIVFQTLPHTLDVPTPVWRVLAQCHQQRNLAEYEGVSEITDRLLADLIEATGVVLEAARRLAPLRGTGA